MVPCDQVCTWLIKFNFGSTHVDLGTPVKRQNEDELWLSHLLILLYRQP